MSTNGCILTRSSPDGQLNLPDDEDPIVRAAFEKMCRLLAPLPETEQLDIIKDMFATYAHHLDPAFRRELVKDKLLGKEFDPGWIEDLSPAMKRWVLSGMALGHALLSWWQAVLRFVSRFGASLAEFRIVAFTLGLLDVIADFLGIP